MADDAAIRLANFKKCFDEPFSPSEAARKLWGTASQWSDLYRGQKSFGEKLARKIEDKLGLLRMSLDDPDGPQPAPLSPELLARLQEAPDDERRRLENMLRAHFGMPVIKTATVTPFGKRQDAA